MSRTHCLAPDACAAAKPTTHCRRCSAARMRNDPDINAKRRANLRTYHEDPANRDKLAQVARANSAKAMENPEWRERLREHGRWAFEHNLSRPEARALNQSPEVRARAARACRATVLAHIPEEHRDTYRNLIRQKGLTAAEAEACIRDIVEAPQREARRAVLNIEHQQRQRAERERAQAY